VGTIQGLKTPSRTARHDWRHRVRCEFAHARMGPPDSASKTLFLRSEPRRSPGQGQSRPSSPVDPRSPGLRRFARPSFTLRRAAPSRHAHRLASSTLSTYGSLVCVPWAPIELSQRKPSARRGWHGKSDRRAPKRRSAPRVGTAHEQPRKRNALPSRQRGGNASSSRNRRTRPTAGSIYGDRPGEDGGIELRTSCQLTQAGARSTVA